MNEKVLQLSEKLFAQLNYIIKSLTYSNYNHLDVFEILINEYDSYQFRKLSDDVYLNIKKTIENKEDGAEELAISIFERYYNAEKELVKYIQGFRENVSIKVQNNEIEYEKFSNIAGFVTQVYENSYKLSPTDYLFDLIIQHFAKDNNKSTREKSYCEKKKNKSLSEFRLERLKYLNQFQPKKENLINTTFRVMLILYYVKSRKIFNNEDFKGRFKLSRVTQGRFNNYISIIEDGQSDTPKKIKPYILDLESVRKEIQITDKLISEENRTEILSKIENDLIKLSRNISQ